MINIDFKVDEESIRSDSQAAPLDAPNAALEETYFESPIRMTINGVEALKVNSSADPWLPLPLLAVAGTMRNVVEKLGANANATFSVPGGGEFKFHRKTDRVLIDLPFSNGSVETGYAELKTALDQFARKVKAELERLVPEMKGHALWHYWIS